MTLTVTDNRTLVDNANAVGSWASVAGEAITAFASDPNPVENSNSLGIAVSIETSDIYVPITAVDLSAGVLVYVWVLANGTMDTTVNGGIQPLIGDGTDTIGFDLAGSDASAFRHESGPVGWQCLLLDTGNLPAGSTAARGVVGSLTLTAITDFGAQFKTLSKALGGAANCFIDKVMYGNGGLTVDGGTTGAMGTFAELAAEDRDPTTGKAYGCLRELGSGLFGAQSGFTFGNTGTADHYFQDSDVTVNWEARGQASGRFDLVLQSNATGVGLFQLGLISGTEGGTNGAALIAPTGSGNTFDASAAAFDSVLLYDTSLKNWTGGVLFSDDATNGINHDIFDCIFDTCGQIQLGRVDMKNCTIVNSSALVAMLISDNDNTLAGKLSFVSDGTGHAMEYNPTGAGPHTLDLRGHSYSGYAGVDGSTDNEVLLINPATSTADVTVNISGNGDTPTIMEAAGYTGTVTVNNNKTVTFDTMKDNSEVRVYATGTSTEIAGIEDAIAGTLNDRNFAWSAAAGTIVDYVIHQWTPTAPFYQTIRRNEYTVPSADTTIEISQLIDRNAA